MWKAFDTNDNPEEIFYREEPCRTLALDQTLYSAIRNADNYRKNDVAISFLGIKITYGRLFRNVDRLADAYVKAGIGEGDCVAILTVNMPVVQENLLALSKIGAISKWIDLRIKGNELVNKINENNCKLIIVFDGVLDDIIKYENEIAVETILVVSPLDYLNPFIRFIGRKKNKKVLKGKFHGYRRFMLSGDARSSITAVHFQKERPSIIVQSSGSTGIPKSIVHTEYNFNLKMAQESFSDLPIDVCKTMHVAIPPFIIYGLCNSVYACLYFGMRAELSPYVSEDSVFNDLGKYDVACAAPVHCRYIYNRICELQRQSVSEPTKAKKAQKELERIYKKLYKVKAFISGGDGISAKELLSMQHMLGTQIINGYGNNEVVGASIVSPRFATMPDSVGIPLKGVTVCTIDNNGQLQPRGIEGELCISSDNLFIEYVNNPEETAKIKQKHDGKTWIHTGDLGYVDPSGFVYITGRNKRLIKRRAFKIAPESIEKIIQDISEVRDCVVVAVPDSKEGEVPFAFVQLDELESSEIERIKNMISNVCNSSLPDYEVPKYIHIIDKIPYKNSKHDYSELTKWACESL